MTMTQSQVVVLHELFFLNVVCIIISKWSIIALVTCLKLAQRLIESKLISITLMLIYNLEKKKKEKLKYAMNIKDAMSTEGHAPLKK